MRVYNINKAIGLASSGVEYAQSYRRQVFAGIARVDDYYVFTDYLGTNIAVFSDRLGFERAQVMWIYNLVTGRETRPSTVSVDAFVEAIGQPHDAPVVTGDATEVVLADSGIRYRIRTTPDGLVDRVETVVRDQIVRVEHYDDGLSNVEHFHDNRLMRRVFYTTDGRIAAEQFYRDQQIVRTLITPASPLYDSTTRQGRERPSSYLGDLVLEGRSRFSQYVFAHLFDRPDDVVIVDRALDVIDGIYPVIASHRLYSVVHADHYDLKRLDDGVLLWNNHYENVFTRPDMVDGFIVSTHRQREVLRRQLAPRVPGGEASVICIPVGVVGQPAAPPEYERFAVVTASRLADEKHLDLLIRAVAAARTSLPELRLDIYGEGNREPVLAVIAELHAEDYVRLMGHRELNGLLGSYGLYASASTSEGFGLSLLEAMAEGLPIVGFDVDYGNRELVESGVNGFLVPYTSSDRDVPALTAAITRALSSDALDDMRARSLRKAESYTVAAVRERWQLLLREGPTC